MRVVDEVVDGQELNCRDAKFLQIGDVLRMGKAGVGAAQLFGNGGVGDGKTAHVDFVDDGVGECDAQPAIPGPVERRIDDDGLGNAGAAVLIVLVEVRILAVEGVGEDGLVPLRHRQRWPARRGRRAACAH